MALGLAACVAPAPPPAQVSPEDLARVAAAPIPISPRVAKIYREAYLAALGPAGSGVFAVSPNGNRFEFRFCRHPDCQLSDDELAARAIERCSIGVPAADQTKRCLVFDRNGRIAQPHRFWIDADFDMPATLAPVALTVPAALAPGRFAVMTPEGQLVVSLRPDGRAYFWDTDDAFHQGTWSLKDGGLCVDSVDQRATVVCGKLFGADPLQITGATLDLFPGKFLPVTRQTTVTQTPAE
jgi:hypothetical protein